MDKAQVLVQAGKAFSKSVGRSLIMFVDWQANGSTKSRRIIWEAFAIVEANKNYLAFILADSSIVKILSNSVWLLAPKHQSPRTQSTPARSCCHTHMSDKSVARPLPGPSSEGNFINIKHRLQILNYGNTESISRLYCSYLPLLAQWTYVYISCPLDPTCTEPLFSILLHRLHLYISFVII